MQQLIITLVALLGMIVPVANSRMAKLFQRILPPMPIAGRVAVDAGTVPHSGTMSGKPQGRTMLAHALLWFSVRERQLLRHQVGRLRALGDAMRLPAASWRSEPNHPMTALAFEQGLFFV